MSVQTKLLAINILINKVLPLEHKAIKGFYEWVSKKDEHPAPLEKHSSDGAKEPRVDFIAKIITGMTGLGVGYFLIPNIKELASLKKDVAVALVTFGVAYDLFMTCKHLIETGDTTDVPIGGEGSSSCCGGH